MRRWSLVLCLMLLNLGGVAQIYASTADSNERLIGLWGDDADAQAQVAGALTIDGRSGAWRAEIAGFQVSVVKQGDAVSVSLPGDQGRYRGDLAIDQASIHGFWIQPSSDDGPAYASPLILTRTQRGVWHGEVHPLSHRVSQYLEITTRDADGSLTAFLRNPEFNFAREHQLSVQVHGDMVTFEDPKRPGWQLHAKLDEDSGHLQVDWQGMGVFDYTRRDRDHALGFYARTPAEAIYAYREPVATDDGWIPASLDEAGLDARDIGALVTHLSQTAPAAGPHVQGLLIARHGKLVLEEYFQGFDAERPHDTRSAGKTFTSLMTGLAIMHGAAFTTQTPVLSLLPQYQALVQHDSRKQSITVDNLLSMTSGLACDDSDDQSPGNEDVMQSQTHQSDWYRYTLDLPMARAPGGSQAVYCTAGINLLGALIGRATGMWLPAFFDKYVAKPLQMHGYYINLMPDGDAYLGGGIYLRPRDFIKLGQLYLSGGKWNGKRVIDQDWIERSTARHSEFTADHGYGYAWHLHQMKVGNRVFREYAAEGNGGQFVIVVPELELVVAITAGNYGDFKTWYALQDLVIDYIIPAALDAKGG